MRIVAEGHGSARAHRERERRRIVKRGVDFGRSNGDLGEELRAQHIVEHPREERDVVARPMRTPAAEAKIRALAGRLEHQGGLTDHGVETKLLERRAVGVFDLDDQALPSRGLERDVERLEVGGPGVRDAHPKDLRGSDLDRSEPRAVVENADRSKEMSVTRVHADDVGSQPDRAAEDHAARRRFRFGPRDLDRDHRARGPRRCAAHLQGDRRLEIPAVPDELDLEERR